VTLEPRALYVAMAAVCGSAVGSFLNVCIYRMPRAGMSVASPRRSHCPSCGFAIPWHDNLPIVSWLWLRGRCRSCRAAISPRYLLVEALAAAAFGLLALRYLGGAEPQLGVFFCLIALTAASIVVAFIDQDLQIIPDEITLPGMMVVPLLSLLVPELEGDRSGSVAQLLDGLEGLLRGVSNVLPGWFHGTFAGGAAVAAAGLGSGLLGLGGYRLYWRWAHPAEPKRLRDCALAAVLSSYVGGALAVMAIWPSLSGHPRLHALWAALLGMAAGAGLVLLVGTLGREVFRKEAMGFGDVKLMGLLGGFTGWEGVLAGFALACLLGSVVGVYRLIRYRSRYLPFGPYLVMGSLAMIIWPEGFRRALYWYMSLFQAQ
jgi:leader peptidase (prepilin peptidase)/N-methyltransferase